MKNYTLVKTLLLLINVTALIVQGQTELFQLASVNEVNHCLQIQQERGALVPCQTENVGLSENTVFLMENGEYRNYKIQLFRTGKCLDYNSATSNLCLSRCDKHELIHWNIDTINTGMVYVYEGSDKNCIFKDFNGHLSIHHCSDGHEKFQVITVGDYYDHMIKEDNLVGSLNDFKISQGQPLYPNPKPAEYLKGNLTDNLLGVMLFRYFDKNTRKATMELEFVHKNFLPTSKDLSYMITHIHTNITYSVQSSEAISKVISKITQNIELIPQYNIRYGSSGSWRKFGGFYYNFTANPRGVPVSNFTPSTINQLKLGFQNRANQYPDYHEQVYVNKKTKGYKWYLDYLYKSTGIHLYSKYAPKVLYT